MGTIAASQGVTRIKYKNACPGNGGNFCVLFSTMRLGNRGCSWTPKPMGAERLADVFCLRFNSRQVADSSAHN